MSIFSENTFQHPQGDQETNFFLEKPLKFLEEGLKQDKEFLNDIQERVASAIEFTLPGENF